MSSQFAPNSDTHHPSLTYRPDIDALRAFAVLVVIGFHMGLSAVPGGFLGVDIFFVLSGYLIGAIFLKESAQGPIQLGAFIERRLRRILPALTAVCVLTIVPAWFLLPPSDFKDFAESLLANGLSIANYYFLANSNYFDPAADLKPLLHTWSLSVEIQFYLFVALCIALGRKLTLLKPVSALLSLSLASLLLALWLNQHNANVGFYIFPTRIWEFGAGVGASLLLNQRRRFTQAGLPLLGLLAVLVPILIFDKHTDNKSLFTLIVVAGVFLLIVSATPQHPIARLLINPVMIKIGMISYSLYLLHNPILVYGRFADVAGQLWFTLAALVLMFILALVSWRFIERPFRNRTLVSKKCFSGFCWLSFALAVAVFTSSYNTRGFFEQRLNSQQQAMLTGVKARNPGPECQTGGSDYRPPSDQCVLFGEQASWAIVGDSHAGAAAYGLAKVIHAHTGAASQWLSMRGCPPGYTEQPETACEHWSHEVVEWLEQNPQLDTVVVVFRLNVYFFGDQVGQYPAIGADADAEPEYRESIWHNYARFIHALERMGKTIIVITPVPEPRARVEDLIFEEAKVKGDIRGVWRADWDRRNAYTLAQFKTLPSSVFFYNPEPNFCEGDICYAIKDRKAYYRDHNHLSIYGVSLMADDFARHYWSSQATGSQ